MIKLFADWFTYSVFNIAPETLLAEAIDFFIYDTIKIFLLLAVIIFLVSIIRSFLPPEKIRKILSQKKNHRIFIKSTLQFMSKISQKELFLIIITGLFIILSVFAVWFLWQNVFLTTIVLFSLAIIELISIGSKKVALMFVLCAIGGGIVEGVASHFGNWHYSSPSFFNIPLWLLPGWGNAGIFIIAFYKLLDKVKWLNKTDEIKDRIYTEK